MKFSAGPLRGRISVPGDKSISHRALIVAAHAPQPVPIRHLNRGRDIYATCNALRTLGATIDWEGDDAVVTPRSLTDPAAPIDCMNSGSTARMLMGVCAGAGLRADFDGDRSLRARPMEPVAAQLRAFGTRIETTDGKLPVHINGTPEIQTRDFILLSPSAQVKSALLFAALFSDTRITITVDKGSRDHTERLLNFLGADIHYDRQTVELRSAPRDYKPIDVPGDFSAAAFFIVAAITTPGSAIVVENVGVNPSRTGLLEALQLMGADVTLHNRRDASGEPVADIEAKHSALQPAAIGSDLALRSIDEIMVLAVAAAYARGETRITGVGDLRNKESDRIAAIERLLGAAGITVGSTPQGMAISGGGPRANGATIETRGDHRTGMAAAALAAGAGDLQIDDPSCLDVSFPGFEKALGLAQSST